MMLGFLDGVVFALVLVWVLLVARFVIDWWQTPSLEQCQTPEDFLKFLGGEPKDESRKQSMIREWHKVYCPDKRQRWSETDRAFHMAGIRFFRARWMT